MAYVPMKAEMEQVGRRLSQWQASLVLVLSCSAVLAILWIFSLSDIFVQFGRTGRVLAWLCLAAVIAAAMWRVNAIIKRPRTVLGVAALIERAFPQLDNHLINYIQFASSPNPSVFTEAYVKRGVPEWRQINIEAMKDRKAHIRANIVLAATLVFLVAPVFAAGRTWLVSLYRIVNPFSNTPPVSLTSIISVEPGDATALQGGPAILTCKVRGRKGHRVAVDIKPADTEKTSYDLGKITSGDIEEFSYRIPRLATDTEYRFRAGDSPFPKWYKLTARPPLAFTRVEIRATPPAYTRYNPRVFDGMAEEVEVPQGSRLEIAALCNLPVTSLVATLKGEIPLPFSPDQDRKRWTGEAQVMSGTLLSLTACSEFGEVVETPVKLSIIPDKEPVITILSPKGKISLPPETTPSVQFSVQDDYGLAEVWIERVPAGSAKQTTGQVLEKWPVSEWTFFKDWLARDLSVDRSQPLVFRVVARDNYPFGERRTASAPVVFEPVQVESAAKKEAAALAAASATLGKIIEMQRANVDKTTKYIAAIDATASENWLDLASVQETIRKLTGDLLQNKLNPLGSMTVPVRKLYMEEMPEVVAKLKDAGSLRGPEQKAAAERSLRIEETILRKLTFAEVAAEKSQTQRKASAVAAMLENLIKGQTKAIASTRDFIEKKASVGKSLVNQQDALASDVSAFMKACREEADSVSGSDPKLADSFRSIGSACEQEKIKEDMVRAAERLDNNLPADAVPLQEQALAKLKKIESMLNQSQVAAAEERLAAVTEAMEQTKVKLDKLAGLEAKVVESMLAVEKQQDKQDKETDLMEEEAAEIRRNMKDALLQVPVDLQIFPELSVANELVEDVIAGFEEVEQFAGSEKWGADKVQEINEIKPEFFIDQMKKARDRVDSSEMWLPDEPDVFKWNTEAFDREEQPKMALGALSSTAEDLVGDLLKESKELEEATRDTATNFGQPDAPPPGWEVAEGDQVSFGAQGKSGNQAPDHKEQSGRGNIGRQGMANGEAAAGSGTIGEGDPNIEERRTPEPLQSGQIQADGDADTKATGGGKLGSGSADDVGMAGNGTEKRMDAAGAGSLEGLEALMARTDALYIKASLRNLRTDSLAAAAHHIRQAADAIAEGLPISQVREYQRKAAAALKQAQVELGAGVSASMADDAKALPVEDLVDSGAENVPSSYKDLVAEYFRSLNESL